MTTGEKQKSSSSNRQNVVLTRPVTPGLNPQPLSSSSQQFNASFRTFQNDRKKGPAHQSAPPNARMHPEPEPVRGFRHSPSTRGTTDTRAERSNLGDGGSLPNASTFYYGQAPDPAGISENSGRSGARTAYLRRADAGGERRGDLGTGPGRAAAAASGRRRREEGRAARGLEGLVGRCRAVAQSNQCTTGNWTWVGERASERGRARRRGWWE